MARPKKEGLDYFPLDVHIFEDEKIEAISGEFGIKGELMVIKLLCAVYEKGYFVVWDELTKAKLLRRLPGTSKDLLEQVVNRLVTWGFFDESLYNSAKVLTSKTIQATFSEATKRRKTQKIYDYWINDDNNEQGRGVNADINPQSKVKESKVNKTKQQKQEKEKSSFDIHNFFQANICPENPTTVESLEKWVKDLGVDIVKKAIEVSAKRNMTNYAYVEGVLRNFVKKNLTTLEAIESAEQAFEKQKANSSQSKKGNGRKEELPNWFDKPEVLPPLQTEPEQKESPEETARKVAEMKKKLKEARA
ncbi:Lin1244/Lin1753 domain-containing protein [Listeria newyorkensis]|uniref:DUF4373 domain-containing protein n=1 Tax=Listeria newyorkensis TaxID=1497681 RepID=A0A841Z141_9LIST|nr:Lin1244/Lin1753 domain-containing protein [Listeria newyorkensis]MBC1459335.1 DUF4373 domain-containing protein [Listeria newyorkensis]